ncbi:hypothetical protein [Brevibacillus sp. SYSU BS000544]|uniref:hypothetical protein n=1 Tax=Brevibacillus sp. SYSU BS000544 TaxID=3416443 RepID=UPI003CE4ED19
MRDTENRYRGLPKRTAPMLFQIIGKFYRGAINHVEVIRERTVEAEHAFQEYKHTNDPQSVTEALTVLFWEFHFYVTCWLQIELALYRLAEQEDSSSFQFIYEKYRSEIERHLHVRKAIDHTEEAVRTQLTWLQEQKVNSLPGQFWFDGVHFGVDEASLTSLKKLYKDVMACKKTQ